MTFKKIAAILVAINLFSTSLFAIQESEISSVMENKINNVLMILKDEKLIKDEKINNIILVMNEVFDYNVMSRISLGNAWKTLSKEEQEEFTKRFEKKLKDSYIEKLELYTDQDVIVKDIVKVKSTRIQLLTNVVGKDETYEIIYKFYKGKNSDWLIYDVDIIGISLIQTYRKQFDGFLKDKPFTELLTTLNTVKKQ